MILVLVLMTTFLTPMRKAVEPYEESLVVTTKSLPDSLSGSTKKTSLQRGVHQKTGYAISITK